MDRNCILFLGLLLFTGMPGIPAQPVKSDRPARDAGFTGILPNLYLIEGASNSFLLKSGSSAILIDAGSENISGLMEEIGVNKIEHILHTHYHRDQCQADLKFKQTGTSIAIGSLEREMLEPAGIYPPFDVPTEFLLNGEFKGWGIRMAPFVKPGIDQGFADGEVFRWKQYTIRVIYTPGHTRGSVSYFIGMDGKNLCFTGDLILKDGHVRNLYSMQWNYLENPGIDSSISSLDKIKRLHPDYILPSHGNLITDAGRDISLLSARLRKVKELLQFERAGRWNWSGFVQISPHVIQDCGTTSQIIISPDGEALLFDCGENFTPARLAEAKRMFGITRIDVIIPSHWHYDHVDGIPRIASSEGSKIWVWEKLAEHLEFPERFPTTCWTDTPIKADRVLTAGEEFTWGGYLFKVYHNPVHMEEQMGLSALVDGLKFFFMADGSASNTESLLRSAIHGYNGISLSTGLIKTAQSFHEADPYICVPAHSNGFATNPDTRGEFMDWAVETTDAIVALLPPELPGTGYDPYWASVYPAKITGSAGETVTMSLRLKNTGTTTISGKFRLKSYGNLIFGKDEYPYEIAPGQTKDIGFAVKCAGNAPPGVHVVTADIFCNGVFFGELPQGYIIL